MTEVDLKKENAGLAALMREKLGVGGRDLSAGQKRAGRMLPRWVRRDLTFLREQETMSGHPRLQAQVDTRRVRKVENRVRDYLGDIDPAERRKDRFLGIAAVVAFNFLLLAGLVIGFLAWKGVIGPP